MPCVRGHYRRKPRWVVREIVRLKAHTNLSCQQLAHTFNRLHGAGGMTVGKTWVAQTIKRNQYEIFEMRRKWKRQVPAPLPRNAVWGMDLTGKGNLHRDVHAILGIIDHGSRLALDLHAVPDKRSVTLLRALLVAVETFGTPRFLRTDNEAVFRSRLFRFGVALLGIRQQFSQPGMPWQNGRIERLFGTLKEKLDDVAVEGITELNALLGDFRFWYNAVRPHAHLRGATPVEAWRGIDPYCQVPRSAHLFKAWSGLLAGVYLRR
jgi:transposase InsO family protein